MLGKPKVNLEGVMNSKTVTKANRSKSKGAIPVKTKAKTKIEASQVIESSKSLFGKLGYKKVTMTDIANAAQISRPTLYALYADKDAVFGACILSHITEFRDQATVELRNAKTEPQKLRVLFDVYIVQPYNWYVNSDAYEILVNASTYAPNEMAQFWKSFEDEICKVLPELSGGSPRRDVARVLVSVGRDANTNAKNIRELEKSIATAIGMVSFK